MQRELPQIEKVRGIRMDSELDFLQKQGKVYEAV
ncbi:hypothetical protein PFRI_37900 [Planktotalea frisia]|uniref:Uncharacterized protein n=1 Tax=Planktotalea frisia TaxID=696762 RepID=A0A1L9NRV9_9RHOB|nr:hypothetical protein PFRI_37900 [Planktotalea frisia]